MEEIREWNRHISHSALSLRGNNPIVSCGVDCTDSYPFALALATSSLFSLSLKLEDISSFSFGLAYHSFPITCIHEFGELIDTWGIRNHFDTIGYSIIASNGSWNSRCRLLEPGDIIKLEVDVDQGVAILAINNKFVHKFNIRKGDYRDYLVGCTLSSGTSLSIITSNQNKLKEKSNSFINSNTTVNTNSLAFHKWKESYSPVNYSRTENNNIETGIHDDNLYGVPIENDKLKALEAYLNDHIVENKRERFAGPGDQHTNENNYSNNKNQATSTPIEHMKVNNAFRARPMSAGATRKIPIERLRNHLEASNVNGNAYGVPPKRPSSAGAIRNHSIKNQTSHLHHFAMPTQNVKIRQQLDENFLQTTVQNNTKKSSTSNNNNNIEIDHEFYNNVWESTDTSNNLIFNDDIAINDLRNRNPIEAKLKRRNKGFLSNQANDRNNGSNGRSSPPVRGKTAIDKKIVISLSSSSPGFMKPLQRPTQQLRPWESQPVTTSTKKPQQQETTNNNTSNSVEWIYDINGRRVPMKKDEDKQPWGTLKVSPEDDPPKIDKPVPARGAAHQGTRSRPKMSGESTWPGTGTAQSTLQWIEKKNRERQNALRMQREAENKLIYLNAFSNKVEDSTANLASNENKTSQVELPWLYWPTIYNSLENFDLLLSVEHCCDCDHHQSFRHNNDQYIIEAENLLLRLVLLMQGNELDGGYKPLARVGIVRMLRRQPPNKSKASKGSSSNKVTATNPNRYGAFEVQVAYKHPKLGLTVRSIHSKLVTGLWPNEKLVYRKLIKFLMDSDVQRWRPPARRGLSASATGRTKATDVSGGSVGLHHMYCQGTLSEQQRCPNGCRRCPVEEYLPSIPLPKNCKTFIVGIKRVFVQREVTDSSPSNIVEDPRPAILQEMRRKGTPLPYPTFVGNILHEQTNSKNNTKTTLSKEDGRSNVKINEQLEFDFNQFTDDNESVKSDDDDDEGVVYRLFPLEVAHIHYCYDASEQSVFLLYKPQDYVAVETASCDSRPDSMASVPLIPAKVMSSHIDGRYTLQCVSAESNGHWVEESVSECSIIGLISSKEVRAKIEQVKESVRSLMENTNHTDSGKSTATVSKSHLATKESTDADADALPEPKITPSSKGSTKAVTHSQPPVKTPHVTNNDTNIESSQIKMKDSENQLSPNVAVMSSVTLDLSNGNSNGNGNGQHDSSGAVLRPQFRKENSTIMDPILEGVESVPVVTVVTRTPSQSSMRGGGLSPRRRGGGASRGSSKRDLLSSTLASTDGTGSGDAPAIPMVPLLKLSPSNQSTTEMPAAVQSDDQDPLASRNAPLLGVSLSSSSSKSLLQGLSPRRRLGGSKAPSSSNVPLEHNHLADSSGAVTPNKVPGLGSRAASLSSMMVLSPRRGGGARGGANLRGSHSSKDVLNSLDLQDPLVETVPELFSNHRNQPAPLSPILDHRSPNSELADSSAVMLGASQELSARKKGVPAFQLPPGFPLDNCHPNARKMLSEGETKDDNGDDQVQEMYDLNEFDDDDKIGIDEGDTGSDSLEQGAFGRSPGFKPFAASSNASATSRGGNGIINKPDPKKDQIKQKNPLIHCIWESVDLASINSSLLYNDTDDEESVM